MTVLNEKVVKDNQYHVTKFTELFELDLLSQP